MPKFKTPEGIVAYETYRKERGRGGDQNDGPVWDAVAAAVVKVAPAEATSLVLAKAQAYETIIGALEHIADSCDQTFCDLPGIKKFAKEKTKRANEAFKEYLRKFPD